MVLKVSLKEQKNQNIVIKESAKFKDDSIKQLDKRVLNIKSTNRQINIENFIINHP